jgi:hypothetical protein
MNTVNVSSAVAAKFSISVTFHYVRAAITKSGDRNLTRRIRTSHQSIACQSRLASDRAIRHRSYKCRYAWFGDVLVLIPELVIGVAGHAASAGTVNGDVERCANLAHPLIAEAPQSLRECSDRNTLYRVEIHCRGPGDGIFSRLEEDFAR